MNVGYNVNLTSITVMLEIVNKIYCKIRRPSNCPHIMGNGNENNHRSTQQHSLHWSYEIFSYRLIDNGTHLSDRGFLCCLGESETKISYIMTTHFAYSVSSIVHLTSSSYTTSIWHTKSSKRIVENFRFVYHLVQMSSKPTAIPIVFISNIIFAFCCFAQQFNANWTRSC